MPIRIVVIAEGPADFRHVSELVDRKLCDHAPDWWDEGQLEAEREYCGLLAGTRFTQWRELWALPISRTLLRHGGILDLELPKRHHFDYPLGRKALIHCALMKPAPDAVLLVRDMDRQPVERRESLLAAKEEFHAAIRVVLALPRAKREAWALAGWDAGGERERAAFEGLRRTLAFHPCECAEELDAMEHGALRDAKRALALLTDGDLEREAKCWREAAWATLRARGQGNGLADFLAEVNRLLVPLVCGGRR